MVQILLLFRETRDWGLAVSRCPALRCAPLRKYVRWLPPYEHLNGSERPKHFNDMTAVAGGSDAVSIAGTEVMDGPIVIGDEASDVVEAPASKSATSRPPPSHASLKQDTGQRCL